MCRLFFGLMLVGAGIGVAQPTVQPQAGAEAKASFEVASIKPRPGPITFSADPIIRGSRVTGTACTLLDLVTNAYGVRYDRVSGGPAWANSDHYDIAAKAEGEATLTNDQARQMLQT